MNRDSDGMTCVGMNKYGKRCRWDISGTSYDRIRALLDAMERRPPNESIQSLRELAGLSLCQDYHQDQASKMVSQWRTAIIEAAVEYENVQELKRRIRSLEESLATEEVKTEELQRKVAELQDQVGSQPELEELQPELERLRVLLQMNR
jgi:chromosome segregation ATPase